jgi:hypothetical protein
MRGCVHNCYDSSTPRYWITNSLSSDRFSAVRNSRLQTSKVVYNIVATQVTSKSEEDKMLCASKCSSDSLMGNTC